jgi:hypothetical protein
MRLEQTFLLTFLRPEHNVGEMNRLSPLSLCSICAVVDFTFGYIKWHTVGAGAVAIICGLPFTALLFLGSRHWGRATVDYAPR